jgi:hypothetical protein
MTEETLPHLIETRKGHYRHYKGLHYEVIGTARHSESLESMAIYRALYGEKGLWVRPAAMFEEQVVVDGISQPRFTFMGDETTIFVTNPQSLEGR